VRCGPIGGRRPVRLSPSTGAWLVSFPYPKMPENINSTACFLYEQVYDGDMETLALVEMFERVVSLPIPAPNMAVLELTVAEATRLEAVLASLKTRAMREMIGLSSAGEALFAKAGNLSLGQANRVVERANMLDNVTPVAAGFSEGSLSAAHVDAFGAIYRRATAEVRARLADMSADLVVFGTTCTVSEFRKRVAAKVRDFEPAEDAEERLIRQKKATRLSLGLDPETGMGKLSGSVDPETYRWLHGQIIREAQARFHDVTPEYCPLDPLDRQQFLQAHALIALLNGTGVAAPGGGPEIVVVHHQQGQNVTIDWGLAGLELPDSSLDRILANRARIFNVAVRNGDIVSAPGDLNLGRSARLANRAQRRALAAVHSTCAVPGCEVRYWQTKLHHIRWWEHGGLTDLQNLIPLCARHHAQLHKDDWKCELRPGRQVVFTLPDGSVLTNGPPLTQTA
jgi:hypothetical protein